MHFFSYVLVVWMTFSHHFPFAPFSNGSPRLCQQRLLAPAFGALSSPLWDSNQHLLQLFHFQNASTFLQPPQPRPPHRLIPPQRLLGAKDQQPPARARQRHVGAPQVLDEAQALGGPHRGEEHQIRLGTLEAIHSRDLHLG